MKLNRIRLFTLITITILALSAYLIVAEGYVTPIGLYVATTDTIDLNGDYISINSGGVGWYKIAVNFRAWQSFGLFGDQCITAKKTSCNNWGGVNVKVPYINLAGMYYPAQHKATVTVNASAMKYYTSVGGTHSSKPDFWGGYSYNPTC